MLRQGGVATIQGALRIKRIPNCHPDRPHKAHGLCRACYQEPYNVAYRKTHFIELRELRKKWASRHRQQMRDYWARNREHFKLTSKAYRTLNKEHLALYDRRRKGRLDPGICAICNTFGKLVRDHNHTTGQLRGGLCGRCNSGLGFFKENIESFKNAILYLEKWNA